MGFVDFLVGALKILSGYGFAIIALLVGSILMAQGEWGLGGVLYAVAFVSGLYAEYQRGQQPKRMA